MARCGYAMEVVVVDDGSRDRTAGIVAEWSARDGRFHLLRQPANQGRGRRCAAGCSGARAVRRVRRRRWRHADRGAGSLSAGHGGEHRGDHRLAAAGVVGRPARAEGFRQMMGNAFYTMVNLLAVPGIRDTQCGFQMFRRDAAQRLFAWSSEKGVGVRRGDPVPGPAGGLRHRGSSGQLARRQGLKVSPLADSLRMFVAVFRIRARQAGFLRHRRAGDVRPVRAGRCPRVPGVDGPARVTYNTDKVRAFRSAAPWSTTTKRDAVLSQPARPGRGPGPRVLVVTRCFCPNGHDLVNRRASFNNHPGILLRVRGRKGEGWWH